VVTPRTPDASTPAEPTPAPVKAEPTPAGESPADRILRSVVRLPPSASDLLQMLRVWAWTVLVIGPVDDPVAYVVMSRHVAVDVVLILPDGHAAGYRLDAPPWEPDPLAMEAAVWFAEGDDPRRLWRTLVRFELGEHLNGTPTAIPAEFRVPADAPRHEWAGRP
jgi:hypothetical protein